MKQYKRKISIAYKFAALIAALVVFVSCVLLIAVDVYFARAIHNSTNRHALQSIYLTNQNVDVQIQGIEKIIDILSVNAQVQQFIKNVYGVSVSMDLRVDVRTTLETVKSTNPEIFGIAILNSQNQMLSNEMYKSDDTTFDTCDWYKACMESPGGVALFNKPTGRNIEYYNPQSKDDIICVAKAVIDRSTETPAGVIAVDIDSGFFENLTENIKPGEEGYFFILGNENEMVYTPANAVIARVKAPWFDGSSGMFTKNILGEAYQFIYFQSEYTNWKTVGVFPIHDMLSVVTDFQKAMLFITLAMLISVILISIATARAMTKPVRQLSALMKIIESGDLSVRADIKSSDEIGLLGNSFNSMVEKINELMKMVHKKHMQKRQAELLMLQAQINPHFLYNAFDTIQWIAKDYKATKVVKMLHALTAFFRLGVSRGKDFITVDEEIEHVRSYLIIQSTRYEDMLTYEIIKRPGLQNYRVPKLILQPLVENAIYHGIKLRKAPVGGKITITAELNGGDICFAVHDNGMGIKREDLDMLNKNLKAGMIGENGYGIYNVNERIRLYFGEKYGLELESVYGEGTTAVLRCAASENIYIDGEYDDDKGIDR